VSNLITVNINNHLLNIPVIEYNNERVLTTEQVATFYGAEPRNIRDNFRRNLDKFTENKHFYKIEGEECVTFLRDAASVAGENVDKIRNLVLWTKRGVSRHAKILKTEVAWDVFELLEDTYFSNLEKNSNNKSMTTGEFLVEVANNILVHEKMLQQHQTQINNLNSIINYLPLKNFCEEHNLAEITTGRRIFIGKVLTRFCKTYNIPTANPTSYGKIGSYPRDVMINYMNRYYSKHFGIEDRIPEIPRFTKVSKKP